MATMEKREVALHNCLTTIWKAYRTDMASFNRCFAELHKTYKDDPIVTQFIVSMGFALAPAANAKGGMENGK